MKSIRLESIKKLYNGSIIIEGLNLLIPSGAFFALLGPSGCGKTTLLRLIGGFEKVDSGRILLGTEDITDLPINQRKVNTVFQNYALFPHLNVFENVAYSLMIRKVPRAIIEKKVTAILQAMHLLEHKNKSIAQLSGGQKQRVALARAMVNEPEVLLLDEPLAALDLKLRERMLLELIELQSTLKTTFLYVTHDQFEALTVADYVALMNNQGKIEQIGTPKEIYEFPVSSFVAQFVGSTNIFYGVIRFFGPEIRFEVRDLGIFIIMVPEKKEWMIAGVAACMSLRPEKIWLSKKPVEGFSNQITGIVESIVYHGRSTQFNIRLKNEYLVQVFQQNEEHFEKEVVDYGDQVYLQWQKENVVLLER